MKYVEFIEEKLSFQGNESLNALRTNIEYSGNNIKTVAITSATPNNGKTVIALELAKSFAKSGKKTLLIDADLRKSVLKERYTKNCDIDSGLSDQLVSKTQVYNAVCKTNIDNFYCLFSGKVPPNPSELLGSELFAQTIEYLKTVFDMIIIDTPPVGSVIDAVLVSKVCDGAIIVINPGSTRMSYLKDIKNQMAITGVKVLGAIINQNDKEVKGYGYGYGYGYGKLKYRKYYKYGYDAYGGYGYGYGQKHDNTETTKDDLK